MNLMVLVGIIQIASCFQLVEAASVTARWTTLRVNRIMAAFGSNSNMTRPAEGMVAFYNQPGTTEQHIKEGKSAVTWPRLSCMRFAAKAVRRRLHALAYNLANFLRTLALPDEVQHWSLTTLRDRLVKTGARIIRHGRSIAFQMAEVMVPRALFR